MRGALGLVLDANYFEATEQGEKGKRMGLYRAKFDAVGREWQTEYVEDGKVTPQEGRLVAFVDSGYGKVDDAAAGIIPKAIKHPGVPTLSVRQNGCDLHFTPGKKRLGGMVRYNALKEESQASYNKVKAEIGDMQLTPTFAPLKWPVGSEEVVGALPSRNALIM